MRRRTTGFVLVVGLAAAALAGCAHHPTGPGVASAGGGTRRGTTSPSAATPVDPQTQLLRYAQCMREHGVDMPDPSGGNAGGITLPWPDAGRDDPRTKAALDACQRYLPNGGTPPSMSPQQIDALRRYAQCMRDHGIQIADPDPNTGAIQIGGGGTGPGGKLDTLNDPRFKGAQAACAGDLPKGGGK